MILTQKRKNLMRQNKGRRVKIRRAIKSRRKNQKMQKPRTNPRRGRLPNPNKAAEAENPDKAKKPEKPKPEKPPKTSKEKSGASAGGGKTSKAAGEQKPKSAATVEKAPETPPPPPVPTEAPRTGEQEQIVYIKDSEE